MSDNFQSGKTQAIDLDELHVASQNRPVEMRVRGEFELDNGAMTHGRAQKIAVAVASGRKTIAGRAMMKRRRSAPRMRGKSMKKR